MANEGLEVEIYRYSNPLTKVNVLNGAISPKFLNELKGVGGGSFDINRNDAKISGDPTLIASRNVCKLRVDGVVTNAFLISAKASTTLDDTNSRSKEVRTISGEGLLTWFNDGAVYPEGGIQPLSLDTRAFNFASVSRGSWYHSSDWVTPYDVGLVFTVPGIGDAQPSSWPVDSASVPIAAHWIWGASYTVSLAPAGTCYFRYEFTTVAAATYVLYAAGDNSLALYLDGTQLATTSAGASAFASTTKVTVTIPAGNHVIGMAVENYVQATGNQAGALLAAFTTDGVTETLQFKTGDAGWKALPYPTTAPGWSPGEIMLKLLSEAQARGVLFPTYLTPTFTATTDSNGLAWAGPLNWSFDVGTSMFDVLTKLQETVCNAWIDPDTYQFNMVAVRGVDRTVFVYDVDGVTALSTPISLIAGKHLRKAQTQAKGKIKNNLLVKTDSGWLDVNDSTSQGIYGVIEGNLSTNTTPQIATQLATVMFAQYSTEEEGATYDVYLSATDPKPNIDFHVADFVLAPDDTGLMVPRQIMTISTEKATNGRPLYTFEFDTVFQSNEIKIGRIVQKLSGGTIGASSSNTSPDSIFGAPYIIPPNPPTIKIPQAPTGLSAASTGYWTADGLNALAAVTLSWTAVTANSDGSAAVPTGYQVWATPHGLGEWQMYADVTANSATIQDFKIGDSWDFKVTTKGASGRVSSFSSIYTYAVTGTLAAMIAPTTPTLGSDKGVLIVRWDGNLTGATMPPPQFRYISALVATSSGGTYTNYGASLDRTQRTIYIAGLVVGTAYWVKLVGVDALGQLSALSASANITLTGIDLGSLSSDVTAAIAAANAAALEAMAVDNSVLDPSFEANDPTIWPLLTTGVTNITTTPRTGLRCLDVKASTAAYMATHNSLVVPVDDGQFWQVAGWVAAVSGYAVAGVAISVEYGTTSALGTTADVAISPDGLSTAYTQFSGVWSVPTGVRFAKVAIRVLETGNTNHYRFDDILFNQQVPGSGITDNAITAAKIGAGEVVAGKLAAGSVAAGNIQAGAIVAGKIAAGTITSNEIAAAAITANKIAAGTITATQLASSVGASLDISSNSSVSIIVSNINSVISTVNATNGNIATMQTYYQFGSGGAVISSPGSPYSIHIASDRIEILQLGVVVSYWTAGQMYVNQLVGTSVVLGNHKIEQSTTGTVVRAL